MAENKPQNPMSKEDASRIQSGTDKKLGQDKVKDESFKERAQSAGDRNYDRDINRTPDLNKGKTGSSS